MTTNYDPIAEQYQRSKSQPWREYIERYTLLELAGNLDGKSAIDLACGEGYYTRQLRSRGTARTVGVDLSDKMIELAREQEQRSALGIDYRVQDAKVIDNSETFDLVLAAWLLNYAHDRAELFEMCRGVASRLQPGGRFVGVNSRPGFDFSKAPSYRQYGFDLRLDRNLQEGTPVTWIFFLEDGPLEIENYYLDRAMHEEALRAAGFREIHWHAPRLAPNAEPAERAYWQILLEQSPFTFFECVK